MCVYDIDILLYSVAFSVLIMLVLKAYYHRFTGIEFYKFHNFLCVFMTCSYSIIFSNIFSINYFVLKAYYYRFTGL